jgi:hypothetical protein
MQYLPHWALNICVFAAATGIDLYSRQGIVVNKVMESNYLVIEHKHGKEIYLIERFHPGVYGRELTHGWGYMPTLDLTWVKKELFLAALHFKTQFKTLLMLCL